MILENTIRTAQTTHHAMGTVMTHKAFGAYAEDSLAAVCEEIDHLEGILSRFLPGSEISRINQSAGIKSELVSFETYQVLSKAVELSGNCPGCFDPTIAPLVDVWSTAKETFSPPDPASIRRALPLVNYRDLILDPWEMTAGLKRIGQSIDLGGIGKGYAGDRILEVYRQFGISSACSNLGGNVVTLGAKPDGTPWQVGIRHPRQGNHLIGSVAVVNKTVVTSGDDQRYFIDRQGKRHHHILNPATGYPAASGLVSVSIVSEESLRADVLSTAVFIAGMEQGLEYLKHFPHTEAVFVDFDTQVYITPGLRYHFRAGRGVGVTVLD